MGLSAQKVISCATSACATTCAQRASSAGSIAKSLTTRASHRCVARQRDFSNATKLLQHRVLLLLSIEDTMGLFSGVTQCQCSKSELVDELDDELDPVCTAVAHSTCTCTRSCREILTCEYCLGLRIAAMRFVQGWRMLCGGSPRRRCFPHSC